MAWSAGMQYFAATDIGRRRKHNEDNFLVDKDMGLCIVADGMGGHAAGEIASAIAVRTVHHVLKQNAQLLQDRAQHGPRSDVTVKAVLELLELAVQTASAKIHAAAQRDPQRRGMGTTLSALLVLDSYGYVAHVGDSRIYLERDGKLHQVTEDHTVANELLRLGMIDPANLDKIPQKSAITRALGVYAHAEVDTLTIEVLPRDQFLLASDGLTGYFDTDDEVLRPLNAADGDEVVRKYVEFANARGGKDNITCVLMRVGRGDAEEDRRARRLALKREVLAHVPLFARLTERELLKVLHVADIVDYAPGDVVVREGERGDQLYITLSGRLQVSRGQAALREINPGEHLGEMALIRSVPRSATVVALDKSELITLKRRDFFEIIRSEPQVAAKLLWQFVGVLAERLEQTSRDLSRARRQAPTAEASQPAAAAGDGELPATDEDPFSQPVPAKLGSLRLGFPPKPSDPGGIEEQSPPPGAITAQLPAPSEPPPPLADSVISTAPITIPKAAMPDTKSTVPDGLGRGASRARTTLPEGEPPPKPMVGNAQLQSPAVEDGRPSEPDANGDSVPSDVRGTLPRTTEPVPASNGPEMPDQSGRTVEAGDSAFDLRATIPLGGRPKTPQPGGGAEPADPLAGLRGEIDKLREEFRERLRKSRQERAANGKNEKESE